MSLLNVCQESIIKVISWFVNNQHTDDFQDVEIDIERCQELISSSLFVNCKRIFVTYLPKWLWVPLRSKQTPLYMSQWHFKCNDWTTQILFCTFSYDIGHLDDNIIYNLTRTVFENKQISFECVFSFDVSLKTSTWRPISPEKID